MAPVDDELLLLTPLASIDGVGVAPLDAPGDGEGLADLVDVAFLERLGVGVGVGVGECEGRGARTTTVPVHRWYWQKYVNEPAVVKRNVNDAPGLSFPESNDPSFAVTVCCFRPPSSPPGVSSFVHTTESPTWTTVVEGLYSLPEPVWIETVLVAARAPAGGSAKAAMHRAITTSRFTAGREYNGAQIALSPVAHSALLLGLVGTRREWGNPQKRRVHGR